MRIWVASVGVARTYQGQEFPADNYIELQDTFRNELKNDPVFIAAINDGFINVSYNGTDPISSASKAISFLKATQTFQSTWATDKNNIDQVVLGDDPVLIEAKRTLWDLLGDYDLITSKFFSPIDGIWSSNGTICVKNQVNVKNVAIEIWRNDEPWFTVNQKPPSDGLTFIPFSCDVDAYASEDHNFDLRIHLEKINPTDDCQITISGSDEETAWGMTFLQQLVTPSPT